MSKLLMCGVSAYLVFSGLVWGPVCGGIIVLITFWDYFSGVAGEMAEDYAATRTRRRLCSDLHAPAHPYWTLRAFERPWPKGTGPGPRMLVSAESPVLRLRGSSENSAIDRTLIR